MVNDYQFNTIIISDGNKLPSSIMFITGGYKTVTNGKD